MAFMEFMEFQQRYRNSQTKLIPQNHFNCLIVDFIPTIFTADLIIDSIMYCETIRVDGVWYYTGTFLTSQQQTYLPKFALSKIKMCQNDMRHLYSSFKGRIRSNVLGPDSEGKLAFLKVLWSRDFLKGFVQEAFFPPLSGMDLVLELYPFHSMPKGF